jgi:hypothetical protein
MALSCNAWTIIHRVYDFVHMALWALLVAGVVFLLLNIPRMREARVIAEAQRALEISEDVRFCEGFRMPARCTTGRATRRSQGRRPKTCKGGNRGRGCGSCRALDLWGFESCAQSHGRAIFNHCRPRIRAQLQRSHSA